MHNLNTQHASFAHRRNDDGTVDSICPNCFQTIAKSPSEPDLQNAEDGHVCNPAVVEHYRELRNEVSKYRDERKGHAISGY
jgi:hypothetical protein